MTNDNKTIPSHTKRFTSPMIKGEIADLNYIKSSYWTDFNIIHRIIAKSIYRRNHPVRIEVYPQTKWKRFINRSVNFDSYLEIGAKRWQTLQQFLPDGRKLIKPCAEKCAPFLFATWLYSSAANCLEMSVLFLAKRIRTHPFIVLQDKCSSVSFFGSSLCKIPLVSNVTFPANIRKLTKACQFPVIKIHTLMYK